jgi:hypothetical protein
MNNCRGLKNILYSVLVVLCGCASNQYREVIKLNAPLNAEYAYDRKICTKDSSNKFSKECLMKATHMASFPCFNDEELKNSTEKNQTVACKCNHHIDTEKSCAEWIESGK